MPEEKAVVCEGYSCNPMHRLVFPHLIPEVVEGADCVSIASYVLLCRDSFLSKCEDSRHWVSERESVCKKVRVTVTMKVEEIAEGKSDGNNTDR